MFLNEIYSIMTLFMLSVPKISRFYVNVF